MALPPSSPRLPSPPPAAEIQIGPKSPAAAGASLAQQQMEQRMEQTILDANAKRRIHPGTRAADFAAGPPLVPLSELDSAFQLQEHLAALHYHHTDSHRRPLDRETARTLAQAPAGTDRTLWLYELCRFLIAQCNSLIVGFLFDAPPCSAATCPEMRASEWQFLCAVHEQPRSCCAIDYCCHTLDWAANVVTNPQIFPSRFVFADAHDKSAAVKNLINVFRRLHRIFAHAWFQHRSVFWSVESQTGLYVFFKTVCDMYDLLPAENYKLPPEAEGLVDPSAAAVAAAAAAAAAAATATATAAGAGASTETTAPAAAATVERTPGLISMAAIAKQKAPLGAGALPVGGGGGGGGGRAGALPAGNSTGSAGTGLAAELLGAEDAQHVHSIGRTNTRRHIRSSPSTGSAVTTVLEQDEDAAAAAAGTTTTTTAAAPGEEPESHDAAADVPLLVLSDQQDWAPSAPIAAAEAEGVVPETAAADAGTAVAEAAPEEAAAAAAADATTLAEPATDEGGSKQAEDTGEASTAEEAPAAAAEEAAAAGADEEATAAAAAAAASGPAAEPSDREPLA